MSYSWMLQPAIVLLTTEMKFMVATWMCVYVCVLAGWVGSLEVFLRIRRG